MVCRFIYMSTHTNTKGVTTMITTCTRCELDAKKATGVALTPAEFNAYAMRVHTCQGIDANESAAFWANHR